MNYSWAIAEKEKKYLYLGFFVSSSNTADVGREEGTGDDPRLLLPRDPAKVFFLPSALASLVFLPGFCFSFFVFSDFFAEPIFAAGAMGTDSVPGSSSGSTSSNTSVLKSCPRKATLQNGVGAAKSQRESVCPSSYKGLLRCIKILKRLWNNKWQKSNDSKLFDNKSTFFLLFFTNI